MKLETLAKIAVVGWGDQAFVGLIGSPQRCRQYINENKDLLYWASKKQLRIFRRMAKETKITHITTKEVIKQLEQYRPEVMDVIRNHPQGMAWLDKQVTELKQKLTS